MKSPAQVRLDVGRLLEEFYQGQIAAASALDDSYGQLWKIMHQVHQAGGKRLRPYLMLVSYEALGGKNYAAALRVATGLELLHAAMLIHDDIIDCDYVRHGQLNISGHYRHIYEAGAAQKAGHYADSAALLAGDLAIAGAYELVLTSTFSVTERLLASRLLGETIFRLAGGELMDTEAVQKPVESTDAIKIALLKTAGYSFVTPLSLGARLAGAGDATITSLTHFGEHLGVAFQLADDMQGLFGEEAATGKAGKSDVSEGKITYLMQRTFALASPAEQSELSALFGKPKLTAHEIARARQIVEDCGAKAQATKTMNEYASKARASLAEAQLPPAARDALAEMVARITR